MTEYRYSREFNSSLDALSEVLEWFNQLPLPENCLPLIIEATTALSEGFTNAVQHAHKHLPISTPILIEVLASERRSLFTLLVWDHGQPYAFAKAMAQLSCDDFNPEIREHHWGQGIFLKLEQDLSWRFSYDRQPDQRNCFLMEKPFSPSIA